MSRQYDCIVSGSCVVDILCRPVELKKPIGDSVLHVVEPMELTGGGITSNAGVTLSRMGMKVGMFSYVGNDQWGMVIRNLCRREGIDDATLMSHPDQATSTTVVMIAADGERSFLHCIGAPRTLDARVFMDHMDLWSRTRLLLLGYYSLLPNLEDDLPEVFAAIRKAGCKTALDSAGFGGKMQPLDRILPHLDVYVPSFDEAKAQTGETDPRRMIDMFRAPGSGPGSTSWLGVKMGTKGVLLSPRKGEYHEIGICTPPGPVVDTTGAGDCFYAGLVAGLLKGMDIEQAGRLGAAAGACCVTARGGSAGGRDYAFTAKLAGL